MTVADRLDQFAMAVSPTWGMKRLAARRQHEFAMRIMDRQSAKLSAWEAGANDRFRGAKWLVSRLSTNTALEQEMETLVTRAEDLFRNDAYAASAVNGRVDNVVGRGFTLQCRIQSKDVGLPEETVRAIRDRFEGLYHQWNRVEKYRFKQRLAERCMGIYGESLEVISDIGAAEKPLPLAVQVISPKRLQTPPGKIGDKRIRMGVEVDGNGRPIAYWIRKADPGDHLDVNQQFDRIPAERVLHTFEPLFPGQLRGVPWMAPGMAALKDIKDFVEAHLIKEQVSACFSAFIKKADPLSGALQNAGATDANNNRLEDLAPGTVQYLNPDEEVTFSNPASPGNTLPPYAQHHLKGFASSIRYPYELLTKTYDNSYSGGRLSLIDGRVAFGCWQQLRTEMSCGPLWHRFVDECVMLGLVPEIDPSDYFANPWPWRRHQWTPPPQEWIDPAVDVDANERSVSNGFKPKGDIIASLGADFEEVLNARTEERIAEAEAEARYQKELKRLGLVSDPETGKPMAEPPKPEPVAVGAGA